MWTLHRKSLMRARYGDHKPYPAPPCHPSGDSSLIGRLTLLCTWPSFQSQHTREQLWGPILRQEGLCLLLLSTELLWRRTCCWVSEGGGTPTTSSFHRGQEGQGWSSAQHFSQVLVVLPALEPMQSYVLSLAVPTVLLLFVLGFLFLI